MTPVILSDVKTAISLPDQLFRRAEALAKQLGIPRSQLYARALGEFLAAHAGEHVTAALDAVYEGTDSTLEKELRQAQGRAVGQDGW